MQLARFIAVGLANTIVYYLLYRSLLVVSPYLAAHLAAWAMSMIFSFFANCFFTYRVRPTWGRFVAFPASVVFNVVFTSLGSVVLITGAGWDERYVPILMGILAIPFTFALTTFILRPSSPSSDEEGAGGL